MTKQLTGWFPGNIKPVRPGVYQRRVGFKAYSYWDGVRWWINADTPARAYLADIPTVLQDAPHWRGLANPPKERT